MKRARGVCGGTPVIMFHKDGTELASYPSIKAAIRDTGINQYQIQKTIREPGYFVDGVRFEYENVKGQCVSGITDEIRVISSSFIPKRFKCGICDCSLCNTASDKALYIKNISRQNNYYCEECFEKVIGLWYGEEEGEW